MDHHTTSDSHADYDPPYPCRDRFSTEYSEFYDDYGMRVALIEEPTLEHAWLLSTCTVPVER